MEASSKHSYTTKVRKQPNWEAHELKDNILMVQEISKNFGCNNRSITEINKGQFTKEEVHWSVES